MNNSKKILFLITSLGCGGAEKQTIALMNGLIHEQFDIHLGYFVHENQLLGELDQNYSNKVFCLHKTKRFDVHIFIRLLEKINFISPDLIVCVNPYPLLYAKILTFSSKHKPKIISILHTTIMPDSYYEFIVRALYKRLINCIDKVVFVSYNQMKFWHEYYDISKELSTVIHNGIDLNKFDISLIDESRISRQSLKVRDTDFIVTICAGLRPEKKHIDLIKAAAVMREKGVPLKILILGDGPEKKKIEKQIKAYNLSEHTILLGFKEDVRPYIALSDVVVLVSTSVETFSIAILEAMALGKPIVMSNVGGASEQVINGVNGYLFPPGDIYSLANKLIRIYKENSQIKMGQESKKLVAKQFSEKNMIKKYSELFHGLLI